MPAVHRVAVVARCLQSVRSSLPLRAFSTGAPATHASAVATPAIAFDIDGVLIRGKSVLPTAREALRKVMSVRDGGVHPVGIPHILLTNGGGATEEAKAAQFSQLLDLPIRPEALVLSHTPMRNLLPKYREELILTIGMTDVRSVARHYGFQHVVTPEDLAHKYPDLVPQLAHRAKMERKEAPVTHYEREIEKIAAIFVLHDPVEWYTDMQLALDILTLPRPAGVPMPELFFSNPDFLFSGKGAHPRLAQGAFRVALAAIYKEFTGRALPMTLYGKPHSVTYQYAESLLHAQAAATGRTISHFYGIGDNPASDIHGANLAGPHWSSVFVRTGTIARSALPIEQPKFDCACVNEAVDFIIAGGVHQPRQ